MAVSRLLQPKSSLLICRLGFSSARTRCCFSVCSDGENDNPPQLKKEAVAEESRIMAVEPSVTESLEKKTGLFSKTVFIRNEVVAYGGSKKATSLTHLFREPKDDQTTIVAENEEIKPEEAISDVILNFTKYKNTVSECLSHSYGLLPSGPVGESQDGQLKEFPPNKCESDQPEYQSLRYEGGERSSPSSNIQKGSDLKDCCVESTYDQAAGKIVKPESSIFTYQHSNEPRRQDAEKVSEITGLLDILRLREGIPSNTANQCSNTDLIKENSLNVNLQRSDNSDGLPLLDFPTGTYRIEDEETSDLSSVDCTGLKERVEVSIPTSTEDKRKLKKTGIARKETDENKALVRFLRSNVSKSDISQYFSSCGEILMVDCPYAKGPLFKTACIYFKTREGLEEAIKKSGMYIRGRSVTVESATSMEKRTLKIPIPSLIGDPNIPAALVKNPTRTIKIEQLTPEMSSHHIEEALAFCKSKVTGYFLGSSPSVAYVEFETETSKERALAKQSINVLGRHLIMLRIDSPRTTVVRISNIQSPVSSITLICKPLGDITLVVSRSTDILDVHFGLAEWPNMLKILNRLNGYEVEGRRLQAEPAPVFPSDVLLALWHQPKERKHLKATAQTLLHKLGKNAPALSLEDFFVDKI